MAYTRNPTWVDYPDESTPITAEALNRLEDGVVASAATADAASAAVAGKADASHTHTASDVTDFAEAVDDRVSSLIVAGANVTKTYDDVAGTLTLSAAGGVNMFGGLKVGEWMGAPLIRGSATVGPYTGSGMDPMWFIVTSTMTFGNFGCRVLTGDAGALLKALLYNSDEYGRPNALIYTSAPLDLSSSGTDLDQTISGGLTLTPGKYWWGAVGTGGTGAARIRGVMQENPNAADNRSFHELSVGPQTAFSINSVGTYAAPSSNVSGGISYNYNHSGAPYFALRRSA